VESCDEFVSSVEDLNHSYNIKQEDESIIHKKRGEFISIKSRVNVQKIVRQIVCKKNKKIKYLDNWITSNSGSFSGHRFDVFSLSIMVCSLF
jgi:hypothetical protein